MEVLKNQKPVAESGDVPKKVDFKIELMVVAPYLWQREKIRLGKTDQIVRTACSKTDRYRIDTDSLDEITERMFQTTQTLKELTDSDAVYLYIVDADRNEIVYSMDDSHPNVVTDVKMSWQIRIGKSVAAHVATTKDGLMVNNLNDDVRFADGTGWNERLTTSIICVPIISLNEKCCAVIELRRTNAVDYKKHDLDKVTVISGWMGSSIEQHQKRLIITKSEHIDREMSVLMQSYISLEITFTEVVYAVTNIAKEAIGAEHGIFYLFDRPLLNITDLDEMSTYSPSLFPPSNYMVLKKLKTKIDGLVQMCIDENHIINIAEPTQDYRFVRKLDNIQGMTMLSMLYIPVGDKTSGFIGVLQMINKIGDTKYFGTDDEDQLSAICQYFTNMRNFKTQFDLHEYNHAHNTALQNVLISRIEMYTITDPFIVVACSKDIEEPTKFKSFGWCPYPNHMDNMINLCYKMLTDICGEHLFHKHTMFVFLLAVKRLHKRLPYMNFEHDVSAMHCVYCILHAAKQRDFHVIEKFALMLAALCCTLDYTSASLTFMIRSNNPLTNLHPTSCSQNHSIWVGNFIIENTGVLSLLSSTERKMFDKQFKENLLSTDLYVYMRNPVFLHRMMETDKTLDWNAEEHRHFIRATIMNGSTWSVFVKPFRPMERICSLMQEELLRIFREVRLFGMLPLSCYDPGNELEYVPELMLKLLNTIGVPTFRNLRDAMPETSEAYDSCLRLIASWTDIITSRGKRSWFPDRSYSF